MQNIYFYPKLTDKLLENCGCSVTKYVFTYSYQGQDFGLLQKGSSTIRISDPVKYGKLRRRGLILRKQCGLPILIYCSEKTALHVVMLKSGFVLFGQIRS